MTYLPQVQRWAFCGRGLATMVDNTIVDAMGRHSTKKEDLCDYTYTATFYSLSSLPHSNKSESLVNLRFMLNEGQGATKPVYPVPGENMESLELLCKANWLNTH